MFRHFILYAGVHSVVLWMIWQEFRPALFAVDPLAVAFCTLITASCLTFLAVQLRNPGYAEDYQLTVPPPGAEPSSKQGAVAPTTHRRLWHSQPEFRQSGQLKIRLRDCIICHQLQTLRAKHCHDCNKCVLTFDHHCPFMGCCIGEKNRAFFYLYLNVQLAQLIVAVLIVERMLAFKMDYAIAFLFVLTMVLALLIGCLLMFHTYLMVKALTTWEYFSWSNITYLQQETHLTNPFHSGACRNIMDYWKGSFQREPMHWQFLAPLTDPK